MSEQISQDNWTEIISPKKSMFDLRLDELWEYRDLVMLFVRRDFVSVYKQTILGPLWHIIQPIFTTIVFTFVFGGIAKLSTDGQPPFLFYMCGVTIWNYFAQCLGKTSNTFVGNAAIFGKVYFPRMTIPVANVISGLLSFGIQFALFVAVYLYFFARGSAVHPNIWLLGIPLFVFIMALLSLGVGIIISSLTTKYRDLTFLVSFGIQLFMYATPVVFPLSAVPQKYQLLISLNPVTPLVEGFRYAFMGTGAFNPLWLFYSGVISLAIFILGLALFHRVEKTFMDTV